MNAARVVGTRVAAAIVAVAAAAPATALPTMIRLGYADCAACHLSPQGGGPLNAYGRGIDQAQSLRGGEYKPSVDGIASTLTLGGRVTQDVRLLTQAQDTWLPGRSGSTLFRPRLMYRNVTALNDTFRVSATLTAESVNAPRPALSYDPVAESSALFVNTALLYYRAGSTIEFAAGRDQLPTGINVPDLALYTKARNRLGYYDAPLQAKMFWNARRFHVTPFAYSSGANEPRSERESGAGTLAEMDVFGKQRTVLGVSLLRGAAENGDRTTVGAYARLGFGAWGVLAEHDVTNRMRESPVPASFQQQALFAQVFWAMREWLVVSAIAERLRVQQPFAERQTAGKLDLTARLASQATVGVSARVQRDALTGRYARSIALQVALKTVQ
jgi:hypothetical protein